MTKQVSLVERAVAHARDGRLTMQSVLWTLAASTVYVPSGADPGDRLENLRPVYYPKDEQQMLAVFTTTDGAGTLGDLAPWLVTFTGEELLRRMSPTDGLVVNPGLPDGFDIPPSGLQTLRTELGS
jgi:SseB protein N-terminal domain